MSRQENGGAWNGYAGVDALFEIRKYSKTIPVFFYIGDKAVATKKLNERSADTSFVYLGTSANEAESYISNLIGVHK